VANLVSDGLGAAGDLALLRERDQLALVAGVSNCAARLELPELIARLAIRLSEERRWDHTSVCLYEPALQALRVHLLFNAPGPLHGLAGAFADRLVQLEGTQSGHAFVTGRPCVVNSLKEYRLFSGMTARELQAGLPPHYSSCSVPLVCRGKRLGTLAAACARDGAFDPAATALLSQIAEVIAPAVDNALAHRQIDQLRRRLAEQTGQPADDAGAPFADIVGTSPALREVLNHVESVAPTATTVLIQGETGTGKELIARALHRLSGRRERAFVKLNCAAIPTGLLESELFGHERGAFTGAAAQRPGRFELAHGGTLFLDEVGELPLEVQPKLLRVLQEQELERVGGIRTIRVDVRVIAASNRSLDRMLAEQAFRADLYYRLNVFPISLPPLRERREDIPALVQHFIARAARRLNKTIFGLDEPTMALLRRHDWPGNIRELESAIERAVILAAGPVLHIDGAQLAGDAAGAPARGPDRAPGEPAAPATLAAAERGFITQALDACGWVVGGPAGAARRLGLSRTTLQARMRKLGLTRPR
jgi:formate hydrogenlyase transcriptional activator